MAAFEIKDWKKVFHLARAYEADEIEWIKFPVNRKGVAYMHLQSTREGTDAFVVFLAIVRLVARSRAAGTFTTEKFPHAIIAAETGPRFTPKMVAKSIEMLSADPVRWLVPARLADFEKPPEVRRSSAEDPPNGGEKSPSKQEQEQEFDDDDGAAPNTVEKPLYVPHPALASKIAKKPDWLPDGKPWITRPMAEQMAQWPGLTLEWWTAAVAQAKDNRHHLDSPGAFVVSLYQEAAGIKPKKRRGTGRDNCISLGLKAGGAA